MKTPPEQLELDLEDRPTYDPKTYFLQPKVIGYRQLTPNEAELMNDVKRLAEQAGVMVYSLEGSTLADPRWVGVAQTHLQLGFMALIRAIAKPTTF